MKVIHINTFDSGGGAADFAFDFLVNFPAVDSCLIVKIKSTSLEKVIEIPLNVLDKVLNIANRILWKWGVKKTVKQIFSLTEELNFTYKKISRLKEYRNADIVHLHNIHGDYFDLNALVKIAKDKPIVWSSHDMWAMTGGEAFTFDNNNYKKGIGFTPYNNYHPLYGPKIDRRQHYLEKKRKIYNKIGRRLFVIPGSNWLANCFRESYVYNKNIEVEVINECIDPSDYLNHNQRDWEIPRILIINSASPFKGAELFNDVSPSLKCRFDLYVIGDKLSVMTHAREVHYYPYLNKKELSGLFNEIDILIFPSKAENFPLTVLGAMSCGVCVIGSETGGITEQLGDNNGILFKNGDGQDLLKKLEDALKDIQKTRQIGNKASFTVKEKYNTKIMYERYYEIYRKLYGLNRE